MDTHLFHGNLPAKIPEEAHVATVSGDLLVRPREVVKQIRAETDTEAIEEWLTRYKSPKTLRAYRRETERFMLWMSVFLPGVSLKSLMFDDVKAYEKFLMDPPGQWAAKRKAPRDHPDWRPLRGPLSDNSRRYALLILRSMMEWLVAAGYVRSNSFGLDRLERTESDKRITRYLSPAAIGDMFAAVAAMPETTKAMAREKARGQFMIALYYDAALRLFEPANASMGSIERDHLGFWINVIGKGAKKGRVPLSPRTVTALKAYRLAFGLSDWPEPGDGTALLFAARGPLRRATEGAIAKAIERIMHLAADIADQDDRPHDAAQLRLATPHWLRHSKVSHLINAGENIQSVRALARHEDLATTGVYSHAEQIELQRLVGAAPSS